MKKKVKRLVAFMLAFALVSGFFALDCKQVAAKKVCLNQKQITLTQGKRAVLKCKNTKKKVVWKSSNSKVVTLTKKKKTSVTILAKKSGKATVTAKVGAKRYRCRVVVVEKIAISETASITTEVGSTTESATQNTFPKPTPSSKQSDENPKQETSTNRDENPKQETSTNRDENPKQETSTNRDESQEHNITQGATASQEENAATTTQSASAEDKIYTGEGTWYIRETPGAANLDDFAEKYGYLTAALQTTNYMDNLAGAYVEITDKDGDKVDVLIADRLPEGKAGDIDLVKDVFLKIEPEVTGRMKISWKIIPLPTQEPISYVYKPTSTQWWMEVQVRNHRYPIAKLECKDSNGQYVELERQEYNYFTAPNGMGPGPYTFRVTDIYGQVLEDENIPLSPTDEVVGKANFPY